MKGQWKKPYKTLLISATYALTFKKYIQKKYEYQLKQGTLITYFVSSFIIRGYLRLNV